MWLYEYMGNILDMLDREKCCPRKLSNEVEPDNIS